MTNAFNLSQLANNTNSSGQITLTSGVTGTLPTANGGTGGTLPVTNGGTGAVTLTANSLLVGAGTSAVTGIAAGTSGNVLTSNGTTWASVAAAGIGVGQTWQNMGRSAGVTFTNSTSKPIFVLITCISGGTTITGTVDGLTFTSGVGAGSFYNASTIYLIVPVGSTYSTNSFGAGSQSWYELR